MSATSFLLLFLLSLAGCASNNTSYRIAPSTKADPAFSGPQLEVDNANRAFNAQMRADYAAQPGGFDKAPQLTRTVLPEMPRQAIEQGISGLVVVAIAVDELGFVRSVRVIQSPHELLSSAVTNAVKQWQFQPRTRQGTPVSFEVSQQYNFRIQN
jgi:TonB family protein